MHKGIADVRSAGLEGVVVAGTRFQNQALVLVPTLGAEDGVVQCVVVAELVAAHIVHTALVVGPRVVAVFVEVARGFGP